MVFSIYSTGDGAFLAEILNAVAMLMGEDGFVRVAAIGLLLGFVLAVMSSIMTGGQKLSITGSVVALAAYLVLFAPKADVIVYDSYSMAGRPVDNVPLGVAVAGTVLSHIGYYITENFETAYSIPGMTTTGYARPLEMLMSVRAVGLGPANSMGGDGNFTQTAANYLNDCTETGILNGSMNPAEIVNAPKVWDALEYPSEAYTTQTYLPGDGPDGQTVTCNVAYQAITNNMDNLVDDWAAQIAGEYDVTNTISAINSALAMSSVGLTANQYMKNALWSNIIQQASMGNYEPDDFASTMLITQATEQARVQFAAEASMFAQFARPLMTFVEGFVYGIVPFMVFVIGFGVAGFKLISRYVLILLWVQLWMPIMSMTNLFVQMSYMSQMDALSGVAASGGSPTNPLSLLGMAAMQSEAANWVAVAGNLIAATPALALTVLYGGAYTMVNLAGRLNPTDTVDETQLAPDLMSNPGVLSMAAHHTNSPTTGTHVTGAPDVASSLSLGTMLSSAESSSRQAMLAAQESYTSSMMHGMGIGTSGGISRSNARSLAQDVFTQTGTSYSQSQSALNAYENSHNMSAGAETSLKEAVTTATAAKAGGEVSPLGAVAKGLKAIGVNISAGVDGKVEWRDVSEALTKAGYQDTDTLRDVFGQATSKDSVDAFRDTITSSAKDNVSQSWERTAQENDSVAYNNALSQLESATQSYQRADSMSQSVGANKELNAVALTNTIGKNEAAMKGLESWMAVRPEMQSKIRSVAEYKESNSETSYGDPNNPVNERRYLAEAALEVLSKNIDDPDSRRQLMNMLEGSGFVSDGMGVGANVDPSRNRGIAAGVQQRVDAGVDEAKAALGGRQAIEGAAHGRLSGARAAQNDVPQISEFTTQAQFEQQYDGEYNISDLTPADRARSDLAERVIARDFVIPGEMKDQANIDIRNAQGETGLTNIRPGRPPAGDYGIEEYINNAAANANKAGLSDAQADTYAAIMQSRNMPGGPGLFDFKQIPGITAEGAYYQQQLNMARKAFGENSPLEQMKPYYERLEAEAKQMFPGRPEFAKDYAEKSLYILSEAASGGEKGGMQAAHVLGSLNKGMSFDSQGTGVMSDSGAGDVRSSAQDKGFRIGSPVTNTGPIVLNPINVISTPLPKE